MPAGMAELLRSPCCQARLRAEGDTLCCANPGCGRQFPIVDAVPVSLNESASIFSIQSVVARDETFFPKRSSRIKAALRRLVPSLNWNMKAAANYRRVNEILRRSTERPRVLVLGGSIVGQGMTPLLTEGAIDLVESDIALGSRTTVVCDAHDIPFADCSFDLVIAQAVLEHVVDPRRCAEEMHRVAVAGGLVYVETPFMQQVHAGPYDFTRFTHLGHRRLFRKFEEIESGAVCGPGMALAWSYQYFMLSFVTSRTARGLVKAFSALTAFWLRYVDRYLIDKPGTLDAASGYYFLGRKADHTLSDRELIQLYRGAE